MKRAPVSFLKSAFVFATDANTLFCAAGVVLTLIFFGRDICPVVFAGAPGNVRVPAWQQAAPPTATPTPAPRPPDQLVPAWQVLYLDHDFLDWCVDPGPLTQSDYQECADDLRLLAEYYKAQAIWMGVLNELPTE